MPDLVTELIVPGRFNGPPSSGNGGWMAGALAGALTDALVDALAAAPTGAPGDRAAGAGHWPPIESSLRQPPPLDTPLHVTRDGAGVVATFGGAVIGSAHGVEDTLTPVDPVDPEQARAARDGYPGLHGHLFPTCVGCGPQREEGDGLRIFGGPVEAPGGRIASTWTPHPSMTEDFHAYADETPRASLAVTWTALDCIAGWAGDMDERLMVLARMTARIDALPVIGEEHVVLGEPRGTEGRKTFTASTLYDADGRIVGTAEHLWITVDPSAFA